MFVYLQDVLYPSRRVRMQQQQQQQERQGNRHARLSRLELPAVPSVGGNEKMWLKLEIRIQFLGEISEICHTREEWSDGMLADDVRNLE